MDKFYFVFSAVGADRIGLVDEISDVLEQQSCNILDSRMAVLGGEFAVIMLLAASEESYIRVRDESAAIADRLACAVNIRPTKAVRQKAAGKPYVINSCSVDAPGIVHSISAILHKFQINIEDMLTDISSAPWTGTPMFHIRAHITIPESISVSAVREELSRLEQQKDLDIDIKPFAVDRTDNRL